MRPQASISGLVDIRSPLARGELLSLWKDIVGLSGPSGLRKIKGFHDESLRGEWKGHRSSRLGLQYRVIYNTLKDKVMIQVVNLSPHDYRKK